MQEITFTIDQRNLLQEHLQNELYVNKKQFDNNLSDKLGQKRLYSFFVEPFDSALNKIKSHTTAKYNDNEKRALISSIKSHYETSKKELKLLNPLVLLKITDEQKKVVTKHDEYKDILYKCGYYSKKNRHLKVDAELCYYKYIAAAEKLKLANKVFLSKDGHNNYYKIAFIYDNKEYAQFSLHHQIILQDLEFISLGYESPEDFGTKRFSLVVTKLQARNLLSTCENKHYPDGVLQFMNVLLN